MKKLLSKLIPLSLAAVVGLPYMLFAEQCTVTNIIVARLKDAHWTQGAPYNDYSPKGTTVFTSGWEAGCVATAAAQELYYWQWPWRLDAVHETSHPVLNESNLALRFDGNVPFDWESMQDSYGDGATLKQKHAAAHLVLACQSLVQMRFVSGGGEAMKNLPGTMEWFEYAGQVTPRASDANLAALRADMEFGSPVQTGINWNEYGGHEVVGLGYAIGTNSVGEAKNLIWLNLGWGGGSDGWYDLEESTSSKTTTVVKAVQLGFRPIKSVQIEPIAPVSGSSVTLNWHLPNCYANKISGFTVAKKTPSASTTTWTDDFSTGGKGRSSNTNEMIVTNERLYGWQGTASGVYTYDEVLLLTESSVLSYKYHDDYMAGMSVRVEAKIGDGAWQTISEPSLHGGWNYASATTETVNLGAYAGKGARFRFVVEYVNASIWSTGVNAANVWFDDLSVSNVKTFETVSTDTTIAAAARSTTFSGLTTGDTYAFSVTPVMSDNSAAVTQTATTTIGTPAATPTINSVTMTPKGVDLVQEGFYADIAMGWNIIDVACSESVTLLEAFISHQSVLPQSKIEVVDNGSGSFSINIDATEVAAKWANQKMILTLKATNATGESAYKDVELCLKASGVPESIPGGKVWTGEDAMFGEDYTAKWAGGVLPSVGDSVTFYVADNEYGATMNLNLSSATTLGYVYATGLGQLTIAGTTSETLTANVLKNDIQLEINSSKFKVNKAIPSANIVIDSGSCLDCEIDQARSDYIKKVASGYVSALTDSSLWKGTVVFANYTAAGQSPSNYGNAESTVRLNGVAGWLANNTTFTPTVELVDDGTTPALNWNNGSTGAKETFKKLKGSGTFKTSGSGGAAERVVINDIDDFTGSFDLSLKRIAIGESDPTTSNNGSISVNSGKSVTVHGGSTWKASGGFYFGGSQTITVNGALNGAISADGTGTTLALAPTATVTAASLSFANNTIRLAKTAEASPTFSVTGAAILTNATIEVTLADGMSAGDSIALMSAASFDGVDSATLEGLDGYSLEVSGGTLCATKDVSPTPDATSLEESEGFVTSESQLAFKDATLAMLTSEALGGKFGGAWAGTADGADVVFNNFDRTAEASGTITCQAQVANDGYVKGVLLTFTQSGGDVYVFMTGAKYVQGASLGDSIAGGSDASQNGEWKYAVGSLSLKYLGPAPTAVWVAGEFGDDRSAHGGLEISLNENTTNALGEIVIGSSTTLGATIAISDGFDNATMLVKYSIPSGGASVDEAAPVSMFVNYDLGAYANSGLTNLDGYWWNNSQVKTDYPFSSSAPSIPQEGYLLISAPANSNNNSGDHYTAVYVGTSVSDLSGGEANTVNHRLRFTGPDNRVTSVGVGGPTVAGAVPWAGMVIKSVALFDEWVTPADLATYRFPGQGAVLPEDSDLYAIEPVAKWVNDFKTTEKNGCTLSVSGTTAAKDDSFGGTLTIGDASAVIDTTAAATSNMTVLIKYRVASNVTNAPVVAFGAPATYGLDVGVYTKLDKTLAVYRNFSTDNGKPYNLSVDPVLSATGGYVLCARDNGQQCMAYVGDSLDAMTGGTVSDGNIKFTNLPLQSLGIGGNSSFPANANDMVPFAGFEIEKIVIFSGYYTPDQIRYVAIPEDGDTLSIGNGKTWNFAAGTTRTYTNIGTLNAGGTIAVTNASELAEGFYTLASWTTAQKKSTGYGRVGALDVTGLAAGLSAELVYGARAIYLRVWNPTTQAEKGTIKVWPYGDSITEGFNAGGTRANYRVLLAQKLSMLGFNVEMVGCYDKINGANGIDPSGQVIPDAWKWHSAKHGATAGPTTSAAGRANLCENVDTLCAQAGNPDVVLLLAGANDIVPATGLSAQQVVSSVTNIVAHIATNLPDTKIVVGNQINVEQGYNSGNYTHVTNMIPQVNALLKNYVENLPEGLNGKVFLADLNSYVKSGEYGILFDHGSDHLHPDWWGHDQMAEGWLSVITNQFTSTQTFPSATVPAAPIDGELGAAAKEELADYIDGFKLCRRIDAASNLNTSNPYAVTGNGATEDFEKVGYFVEYVRADNNAHKWVWVDMDAFGMTIDDVGLPTTNHQQVVTKLHVKSNHNGIENVAADDDSVTGFVEFSPYGYTGNASAVSCAPAGNGNCCDWNDTLSESGTYSCMQVHRVFSPAKAAPDGITRGGQVLFAYNNWRSSSSTAEFGIGNFSSHFYRGASDAQTLDYTYTANAPKMNADAYSVKRIEIWTKGYPEDPDAYAIPPEVVWYKDFKTTEKTNAANRVYTLTTTGSTVADDKYGSSFTIGNSAAIIDTAAADNTSLTVLVKYRSAPSTANAAVTTFGTQHSNGNKIDVGAYTKADKTLAVNRTWNGGNNDWYDLSDEAKLSSDGGYMLCARKDNGIQVYTGVSLASMTGGNYESDNIKFSGLKILKVGLGGGAIANANTAFTTFDGFVVEKVAVFNGYYTPDQIRYNPNPEEGDTLSIADGATWNFAAGTTRIYTNIGTLNAGGTIAITNASELSEGYYTLATWTNPQIHSTGYGRVGAPDVTGLPEGLSAELVYGVKAIYLRVWNPVAQAVKGTIKLWPYGDSITEGFNLGSTKANYRVLLAQKLTLLGYNVEMVGCYDKVNGADAVDPSGVALPNEWKWHSAKHGATAGPTTNYKRGNLCENVDSLCAQVGTPDAVLLHIGVNDLAETAHDQNTTFASWTNVVSRLVKNLPDTKIVVSTALRQLEPYRSNTEIDAYNVLIRQYISDMPEEWKGHVYFADLETFVDSQATGILYEGSGDNLHPDWWGHDQMAEGWLSVITNQFEATQEFLPVKAEEVSNLGAAAKSELADYRKGFKRYAVLEAGKNILPSLESSIPYTEVNDEAATADIEKVGYFAEYVRADNNAHKWVWVDMDAFGTTIADVGLPTANHQKVVTKLHVKSNHNGIEDVAADDDTVTGFVEFSPYNYNGTQSGVSGAPAGNSTSCDWNDTLTTSGSYACMQVHRIEPAFPSGRKGQVLFAYNNWRTDASEAEFGIGNLSQHFYTTGSEMSTIDCTFTKGLEKLNAAAYSVKRIEIWTKTAGGDEPEEKTTSTENGAYPVPYSWFSIYAPGITDDYVEQFAKMSASNNQNTWWQCYVLGLDPTNETSKFTVSIRMDGMTPVVEYSPTNTTLTLQYILQGKPLLINDWQDVEFDEPGDTNRFFRVKVTW